MFGQAGAERVGPCDDDTVFDTHFEERVAASANFREEVFVRNGNFTILVAALFLVRDLVLDLKGASTGFNHLLCEKISGFCVTKACINVGDDRNNVGFVVVDSVEKLFLFCGVASFTCSVDLAEHHAEFARVRLLEERVELFDQRGHGGFFVHGLVREWSELRTQSSNHPTREVEVAALGRAEMLLDRNHLLLTDKTVPAAQRLRVIRWVSVVGRHVFAHDFRGIASNIETCAEPVLRAHPRNALGRNAVPGSIIAHDELRNLIDVRLITHGMSLEWLARERLA